MTEYQKAYKELNDEQRLAVDTIEAPVLVLAGPGTGKTQLLSIRVAEILRRTDTLPQNILCLTFTESGASNMRERLTRFIGREAYDVAISTYHAFGGDLIRRFPEYFTESRLERPVDELGKRQILAAIIDKLSYQSPLKQARWHIGDVMSTISEVKRGLLTPANLRKIASTNLKTIEDVSPAIADILEAHTARLPSKLAVAEPLFQALADALSAVAPTESGVSPFESLAALARNQLNLALTAAAEAGKTTPLTKWKNDWLAKNDANRYILAGSLETKRCAELANVLEAYEAALAARGLYDFDDMILRSIKVLEEHGDLKFTLQEQYQYILLDEFQDTNKAQLRIVELLTDNPVHNRKPNVLAVGDDDQAIYAFQGAQYSNMRDYFNLYDEVLLVNLQQNYRSTPEILSTARNVADQIKDTLSTVIPNLEKILVAARDDLPPTTLQRIEYASEIAERGGIAQHIRELIEAGTKPSAIAVLAPKHKYLEPLVPYLEGIPLRYERRENILEAPVIRQLITMSKLVLALHNRQQALADSYWPEVLSYDFWKFPISNIWNLSWQARADHKPWSELLLADPEFRPAALLFLGLASQVQTETLEVVLDRLIGTDEVTTHEADLPRVRSPLRAFLVDDQADAVLYRTVTELTVLRARLHEHELQRGSSLGLDDLIAFIAEYEAAEQPMLNTSPYNEAADAVQLMTVFKAKGLEFEHVFLVQCQDDVWGNAARNNGNKLTLPANLAPIRHAGASEDERLRLFFVGLTRAKHGLYLTSHSRTYAGNKPPRLKFLDEVEQPDDSVSSQVLPAGLQTVQFDTLEVPALASLETNWQQRHSNLTTSLRELLQPRLDRYRLSPTHLTTFIDLEHAGPQSFLMQNLLQFPGAPTVDLAFGNAMHETMEWLQLQTNTQSSTPDVSAASEYLTTRLQLQSITTEQIATQQARGNAALQIFLNAAAIVFKPGNRPEYNFRDEGVLLGEAQLAGKIDLLEIDKAAKTITVIDYKTGSLGSDPAKIHRYELQLYCYKLLLANSHSFRDYTVEQGCLVFVEPDQSGHIIRRTVDFKAAELERVSALLQAMWRHVKALDMPDISSYGTSLSAIKQFEQDLLDGTI